MNHENPLDINLARVVSDKFLEPVRVFFRVHSGVTQWRMNEFLQKVFHALQRCVSG